MWLLHADTETLHYFNNAARVPGGYAILSHTWGDDEVTFDEIQHQGGARKQGYTKIHYTCSQALEDGFTYAWVDTCCIDKRSSAELTEAINSMFRWYACAGTCYVYLSDVEKEGDVAVQDQLRQSRWFTRGWTLQELIAPASVKFYDKCWTFLGERTDLLSVLNEITCINKDVLNNHHWLRTTSVAQKMSWAADRTTTRVEDEAYSLLGIFNVNMPLLYGEGRRAFQRLQEEIIRSSPTVDHSILAWKNPSSGSRFEMQSREPRPNLLAESAKWFREAQGIISWTLPQSEIFEISQRGLRLTAPIKERHAAFEDTDEAVHTIALNCRYQDKPSTRIVLILLRRPHVEDFHSEGQYQPRGMDDISYDRGHESLNWTPDPLMSVDASAVHGVEWTKRPLTITRQSFVYPLHGKRVHVVLKSCRDSPNCPRPYRLDREHMLPLMPFGPEGSGWSGHFKLEVPKRGDAMYEDADTTSITIDIRHFLDRWTGDRLLVYNRPPYLFVGTRFVKTMELGPPAQMKDPLSDGETRLFPATNGNLSISARYVNLVGEFLWSIKIVPVGSEDDCSSGKKQSRSRTVGSDHSESSSIGQRRIASI